MHKRRLIGRAPWSTTPSTFLACAAAVLLVAACGPGPTNGGPTPTGDVSITVTVVGDGRATFDAAGFACTDTCTLAVDAGTDVELAAAPSAGRVLVAWDGPCNPLSDTCAWQADEDVAVTVRFAPHALRFDLRGDGEGVFVINAAGDETECREACAVGLEQPLAVTIIYFGDGPPRTLLGAWSDACADETDTYCLVNVEGVTVVGKTWRHPPIAADHAYTTDQETLLAEGPPGVLDGLDDTPGDTHTAALVTDAGNGTVELEPDGSFRYEPDVGFAGDDTFTFRITDAFGNTDDGTATVRVRPRLTLLKVGAGSVTSDPVDVIDCGSACTSDVAYLDGGSVVTLTATADPGATFEGWTGYACDPGSDDLTCIVTVDAPVVLTATFGATVVTLTVATAGDGSVTSAPAGIDTTIGDDTADFDAGTTITLTATPDPGDTFTAWTGVTCDGGNDATTCTFDIDAATDVTATFAPIVVTLTVATAGDGSVTSAPAGIDTTIGDDTADFDAGTTITLTATPDPGDTFTAWTGVTCDGGNDATTCTFDIDAATDVTATFSPTP